MSFTTELKRFWISMKATSATKKGDYNKTVQLYTDLININKQSKNNEELSNSYIQRAITYYVDLKNYDKALQDINNAIQLSPQNDDHLSKRALVLSLCGEFSAALEDVNEALRINPNNSHANKLLPSIRKK